MRLYAPTRALLLTITVGIAIPMHAGPHRVARTTRDQIENLEAQWKQAALSNNIDAMDHLLSDDYLAITSTGQVVTKPQQLDRMRSHSFAITSLDVSDMKIKLISQRAAIVTSLAQVDGTNEGHAIHGSFRYTRVYFRVPGTSTWKITSFEATHVPRHLAQAEASTQQP